MIPGKSECANTRKGDIMQIIAQKSGKRVIERWKGLLLPLGVAATCFASFALVWRLLNGAWPTVLMAILGLTLVVTLTVLRLRKIPSGSPRVRERSAKPLQSMQRIHRRVGELSGKHGNVRAPLPSYFRTTAERF
jgi:hypothetical protein